MEKPTPTELSKAAGISLGYASMLLNRKRETCSLTKALQIFDTTGLQFGLLKGMTREEIEPLRRQIAA